MIKKHSFIPEILIFSSIFLLFIVSPIVYQLINPPADIFTEWTFPIQQIGPLLLSIIILFFFYPREKKNPFLFSVLFPATFCFCLLFFISLIFKFFAVVFPLETNSQIDVALPKNIASWIFCILNFIIAAFNEEVLYRFYIPETISGWIVRKSNKRLPVILSEILCGLIFSLGHLYLGIYSVLVAFFAHFVLRFFFKKTRTIFTGTLAHFLYNMISLILL